MELQYYGANCLKIVTKNATVVVDDNLKNVGLSAVTKPQDIALFTYEAPESSITARHIIADPGEYEVSNISIKGVSARGHMDEAGQKSTTMYKLVIDDMRIALTGHIHPDLSEAQLEELGTIDVLCIPVGGNGYTLDGLGALKVIKAIEPKIVIPTHYEGKGLKYEVSAQDLETALKALNMEASETVPKLKLKSADIGESLRLIVLERQ